MKSSIILFLLFAPILLFSQDSSINFKEGSLDDALQDVRQQGKPLFIYVHGDACSFCRIMERKVFPDKEVSAYYNTTFIDYKINLDEANGKVLKKKFYISGVPAYLYFDKAGNLVHKSGAGKSAQDFIQDGRNAFDSTKAYVVQKNRYYSGDRSPELLYNFSNTLLTTTDSPDIRNEAVEIYLKKIDDKDILQTKNLEYIVDQTFTINDAAAAYYFKHQKLLLATLDKKAMAKKNMNLVKEGALEAGQTKDTKKMDMLKTLIKENKIEDADQLIALAQVNYLMEGFLQEKKQWKPYVDATLSYGRKYARKDDFTLRETATYIKYYGEKAAFSKALQISEMAIDANKSFNNVMIKAKLLDKLGNRNAAYEATQEAIAVASPDDDVQDAKDFLEKISKENNK